MGAGVGADIWSRTAAFLRASRRVARSTASTSVAGAVMEWG